MYRGPVARVSALEPAAAAAVRRDRTSIHPHISPRGPVARNPIADHYMPCIIYVIREREIESAQHRVRCAVVHESKCIAYANIGGRRRRTSGLEVARGASTHEGNRARSLCICSRSVVLCTVSFFLSRARKVIFYE